MNRAGKTILDRREQEIGGPLVDRGEERLKRRTRYEANLVPQELDRGLLAEGAAFPLESYASCHVHVIHSLRIFIGRDAHPVSLPDFRPAAIRELCN